MRPVGFVAAGFVATGFDLTQDDLLASVVVPAWTAGAPRGRRAGLVLRWVTGIAGAHDASLLEHASEHAVACDVP
ncbi:MAG TPA: hypothetical protein VK923_17105 [Euzebyales bacterium]|nr:hypothetical protein [Euzebyales bacterium]